MKKTITIIACAAAMFLTGKANAQLGINAGYAPVTLSTAVTSGNTTTKSSSDMDGFFAGVTYNYGIANNMGVAFGLQGRFYTKTSTGSGSLIVISANDKSTTTQLLLDVPVLFNYSLPSRSAAVPNCPPLSAPYSVMPSTAILMLFPQPPFSEIPALRRTIMPCMVTTAPTTALTSPPPLASSFSTAISVSSAATVSA